MIQKQLTAGGKDISQLVEKVTWSGDSKQVARKLAFSMATRSTGRFLPKVTINEGDSVLFKDGDRTLFGGPVFDIEKSAFENLTTYTAFDLMFYINNSDISKVFDDTPEHYSIYTFELIFQNVDRVIDCAALDDVLELMKPAHLLYRYKITIKLLEGSLRIGGAFGT